MSTVAAPTQSAPRALTTRFGDFWLLGGASILVWLVMMSVQGFRASWAIDQHFKNLTITTASLSLLVNYPHFLVSYKLAYTRGRGFILEHWWQLVAVPLLSAACDGGSPFITTTLPSTGGCATRLRSTRMTASGSACAACVYGTPSPVEV